MPDTQYELFRDLDRRCIAGGLEDKDCQETVLQKRASIESERMQRNPIVKEVLAGENTLVAIYDSFSREFRGLRRFIPHRHSEEKNERLRALAHIIPNVKHFTRRSVFAFDNPVSGIIYGTVAAFFLAVPMLRVDRGDDIADRLASSVSWQFVFLCGCGITGFIIGVAAMLKYRTRDPRHIHAREAAAYMDLNYAYYRLSDNNSWAQCIKVQGETASVARTCSQSTPPANGKPQLPDSSQV